MTLKEKIDALEKKVDELTKYIQQMERVHVEDITEDITEDIGDDVEEDNYNYAADDHAFDCAREARIFGGIRGRD